jgi:hypothetical protein
LSSVASQTTDIDPEFYETILRFFGDSGDAAGTRSNEGL